MTITMLRPPSQTKVTQFLRDALAEDALGVPKLELMARAAGLLGEHQSISHMKVFKRAKKSLGITSRRTGFGARSQWLWQLPRQSEGSLKTDSGTARERRVPIPIDWVQGVACLHPDRPPDDPAERTVQILSSLSPAWTGAIRYEDLHHTFRTPASTGKQHSWSIYRGPKFNTKKN
jgi:hypothetical protein